MRGQCAWCVLPNKATTRLGNGVQILDLCRDCAAIARREGWVAP